MNKRPGSRAHVLLVSHEATRTGAVGVALHVLGALKRAGYRVTVVLREGGPLAHTFESQADSCITKPAGRLRDGLRRLEHRRSLAGVGRANRMIARRVLSQVRPDIVYGNSVMSGDYVRTAYSAGVPSVLHVHELGAVAWYGIRVNGVNGVPPGGYSAVAPSLDAAVDLALLTGRMPTDVHVHPSPVDVSSLRSHARDPDDRPIALGGCGLVDPWKGPDLWLEIVERLAAAFHDRRFEWVGRGSMLDELRAEVERRSLRSQVRFVGEVDHAAPRIARFKVLGLTSRIESQSLVALEAMALRVPVVAFDAGAVRQTLGAAGILVPAFDVEAFVTAVRSLLGDDDRARQIIDSGVERVERFDIATFEERTVDLVSRMVGRVP